MQAHTHTHTHTTHTRQLYGIVFRALIRVIISCRGVVLVVAISILVVVNFPPVASRAGFRFAAVTAGINLRFRAAALALAASLLLPAGVT